MKIPNLQLMRHYGNEEVFFQKTASEPPLARRSMLLAEMRAELERLEDLSTTSVHLDAQKLNAKLRLMELSKMEATINNAHHTRAPMLLSGGPNVSPDGGGGMSDYTPAAASLPVGMTEGMVRLASAIGQDLAKAASPYRTAAAAVEPAAAAVEPVASEAAKEAPNMFHQAAKRLGLTGKTLGVHNAILKPTILAGGAAALYAGSKVMKSGLNWLGQEPKTPTYNAGGNQLASNVNEYGQAQLRLPSNYY